MAAMAPGRELSLAAPRLVALACTLALIAAGAALAGARGAPGGTGPRDPGVTHADVAPQTFYGAETLVPAPNGNTYIGGAFETVNGEPRAGLAALDRNAQLAPGFAPDVSGHPNALAASASALYVGGTLRGPARERLRLAALDPASGRLLPGFAPAVPDGPVTSLVLSGRTLYVASRIRSDHRTVVLALDATTGRPRAGYHPPEITGRNTQVWNMAQAGGRLYLVGTFTRLNGVRTLSFAAVDAGDGRPIKRFAGLRGRHGEFALSVAATRSTVFVAGALDGPGGATVSPAAFDARSGRPLRRFGSSKIVGAVRGGPIVRGLGVVGRKLYVGGSFVKIGGVRRSGVAVLDTTTGRVLHDRFKRLYDTRDPFGLFTLAVTPRTLFIGGGSGFSRADLP
jgi:hypothetical protein